MSTPKRPNPEFNAGAEAEREKILAHIEVMKRKYVADEEELGTLDTLAKLKRWVKGMPARAAKRPGGAGRQTKKETK